MEFLKKHHLTIIKEIGTGGMGVVYLAEDENLHRKVAVKILRKDISAQEEAMERFRNEAVLMARLQHPNITLLYNLLHADNQYYMIMEYVDGQTLDQVVEQKKPSVNQIIDWMVQVLDGLQHAHNKGIIHRDIKPANLMLSADGTLKIMDFGIACISNAHKLTKAGYTVGTLDYMPPELIKGKAGNEMSDIYSVGIVLYELLTGEVPFQSSSDIGLMFAHIEEKPLPPLYLNDEIPSILNKMVLKAIHKDPTRRFVSAEDFKIQLLRAKSKLQSQPRFISKKASNGSLFGFVFLGISLLAAAIIIAVTFSPRKDKKEEFSREEVAIIDNPMTSHFDPNINSNLIDPVSVNPPPSQKEEEPKQKPDPKAAPKPDPKAAPKTDPKSAPKTDPKAAPKTDPKPAQKQKEPAEKKNETEEQPEDNPNGIIVFDKTDKSENQEKTEGVIVPVKSNVSENETNKTKENVINPPVAKNLFIPGGTEVQLNLDEAWSSGDVRIPPRGLQVSMTVKSDVIHKGQLLIRKGAKGYATLQPTKKGRVLSVVIDEVESITGLKVKPVKKEYEKSAYKTGDTFTVKFTAQKIK